MENKNTVKINVSALPDSGVREPFHQLLFPETVGFTLYLYGTSKVI